PYNHEMSVELQIECNFSHEIVGLFISGYYREDRRSAGVHPSTGPRTGKVVERASVRVALVWCDMRDSPKQGTQKQSGEARRA
ncbi:hypothetical protein Tco_0235907, partial [Tanacetum coccineum]